MQFGAKTVKVINPRTIAIDVFRTRRFHLLAKEINKITGTASGVQISEILGGCRQNINSWEIQLATSSIVDSLQLSSLAVYQVIATNTAPEKREYGHLSINPGKLEYIYGFRTVSSSIRIQNGASNEFSKIVRAIFIDLAQTAGVRIKFQTDFMAKMSEWLGNLFYGIANRFK